MEPFLGSYVSANLVWLFLQLKLTTKRRQHILLDIFCIQIFNI